MEYTHFDDWMDHFTHDGSNGGTVMKWLALLSHSKKVPWLKSPGWGLSVGSLHVLLLSETLLSAVQRHAGLNVNGCLPLCVSPWVENSMMISLRIRFDQQVHEQVVIVQIILNFSHTCARTRVICLNGWGIKISSERGLNLLLNIILIQEASQSKWEKL